jgi:biopolymer transport protein ExbB
MSRYAAVMCVAAGALLGGGAALGADLVPDGRVSLVVAQAGGAPASAPAMPEAAGGGRVAMGEIFFMQRHPSTKRVEWIGSAIIWGLIILSGTSVAIMGARVWDNRRGGMVPDDLIARGDSLLKDGRLDEFLGFVRNDESDFARAFEAGLSRRGAGEEAVAIAVEEVTNTASAKRLRRIEALNIIGNVGPMIGLFGTVYGMILVFRAIVAAGGAPDPSNLAAGIGTKLVGTFWGLIVAIPALSAYALLRNRIEGFSAEAAEHAKRLVGMLAARDEGRAP